MNAHLSAVDYRSGHARARILDCMNLMSSVCDDTNPIQAITDAAVCALEARFEPAANGQVTLFDGVTAPAFDTVINAVRDVRDFLARPRAVAMAEMAWLAAVGDEAAAGTIADLAIVMAAPRHDLSRLVAGNHRT